MKIKENIKIASFDLDDTLLYKGELSKQNETALIDLHQCGCINVINTGRGLRFVPDFLKKDFIDYIICSNGSIIYDNHQKRSIQMITIEQEDVNYIYSLMKGQHAVKLMVENATYVSWDMYGFYIMKHLTGKNLYGSSFRFLFQFLSRFTVCFNQQKFIDTNPGIIKMECSCRKNVNAQNVVDLINKNTNAYAVVVKGANIEVCSKLAGKGKSLLDLANSLNIPKENIAAFGDSGNDIDALKVAKYAIAVENATEPIKKIANIHIGLAKEDGVGKYIESILEK